MRYTDSHAHLSLVALSLGDEAVEGSGLSALLREYAEEGEAARREGRTPPLILDPGTEPGDLNARLSLLASNGPDSLPSFLRIAAGIWPSAESLADPAGSLAALESMIAATERRGFRISGIGEGGLDYHHMDGTKERQAELFAGQLRLGSRLRLPMIVHSRDAAADTLSLILQARAAEKPGAPVIIHCFGYGPSEARAFLDAGCWLSFAGNLTYKGSDALRAACAAVPADRFLLETDSPYMNPMPRRGQPCSPLDIERTYALAASLRGVAVRELAETVSHNARALFG